MKIKITGLPQYQERPGTVGDDEWIRKIMEYEASKGGYNPSKGAYGLSNWGYNSRNPTSIEQAIDFYKQDFLPKVEQYPMGMRERAGDFMYNAGRDPRIYMLDQYLRSIGKGELPNRSSYNIDINKNPSDWDKMKPQFETEWNKYSADIDKLPIEQRINLLDKGRDFYYQNINRVNNKPNPAYEATWKPRINIFGQYQAPAATTKAPVQTQTAPVVNTAPPTQTSQQAPYNFGAADLFKFGNTDITGASQQTPVKPDPILQFKKPWERPADGSIPEDEMLPNEGSPSQQVLDRREREDDISNTYEYLSGKRKTGDGKDRKKQMREYNAAMPAMITAGMSWMNNLIGDIQNSADQSDYTKKLGQTDAGNPVVKNVYSRGRNVLNTGVYAPNMMTPIQFAGRPTSEYLGYPIHPYAQDGLNVTEDIMGMSSLVADPSRYSTFGLVDPVGPTVPSQPSASTTPPSESFLSGDYVMPVKDFKITSGFGKRHAPIKGASTEHNGVDLGVPVNTPIFAPTDGVVEKVYFKDKGGKQLVIRHSDGTTSGYAHLNDYNVNVGDRVTKGQQIALSGNTGNSSGPHLHFTFRNAQGQLVDPIDYFNMRGTSKSRYNSGVSNLDHNNPGNIHIGNFASSYKAIAGRNDAGGKVAIFPTMETGLQAMNDLLYGKGYIDLTISEARNKWVNGKTNVSTPSTSNIVNSLGGDYRLSQLNPEQRKKLLSEFIKWEDRNVYNNLKKKNLVFKHGGVVPKNNTMKIKITGTPLQRYADGGKRVGDQMGYGLYRGQSVRDFNAFNKIDQSDYYDRTLRHTETGVDRDKANIEAEKGEKIIARDGMSIMDIKGKKHSQGGTPMNAEAGSYILSDFIRADKKMQAAMGFEVKSSKPKDNTWSKVLDSKVKSKDFNRLSQILQEAAAGKEVDPFELATAKSKMPVYADYVSKAALGNELTKMSMGKPYEIPEIAMPALAKMFPQTAEKMMQQKQARQEMPQEMPQQPMAKYGMEIPQYQIKGLVPDDNDPIGINKMLSGILEKGNPNRFPYAPNYIVPWTGDRYENKANATKYTAREWADKLRAKGYSGDYTNLDVQKFLYSTPEGKKIIDELHGKGPKGHGMPKGGMFDAILGYRWESALDAVPDKPVAAPPAAPPVAPPKQEPPAPGKEAPPYINPEYDKTGRKEFPKTPYTQDVVNFATAVANQYSYPDVGPYRGRYNPIYMDPAFVSTDAADRLLQSQARTAMEDASLYAGSPQVQAARQAQAAQQIVPGLIQNRMQTNQQNIGSDMATRQFNTQIANQAAMTDAQITSQLAEDNARLAMNRAKEKVMGRTASKNMLNQMLTNAGDTYLLNQMFPQYAFNPSDYNLYFKEGLDIEGKPKSSSSSGASYADLYNYYLADAQKAHPNDSKKAEEVAKELAQAAMKSRSTSTTYDPRQAMLNARRTVRQAPDLIPGEFRGGGFIPMYYTGGWY